VRHISFFYISVTNSYAAQAKTKRGRLVLAIWRQGGPPLHAHPLPALHRSFTPYQASSNSPEPAHAGVAYTIQEPSPCGYISYDVYISGNVVYGPSAASAPGALNSLCTNDKVLPLSFEDTQCRMLARRNTTTIIILFSTWFRHPACPPSLWRVSRRYRPICLRPFSCPRITVLSLDCLTCPILASRLSSQRPHLYIQ
jgi:hypothetical protein